MAYSLRTDRHTDTQTHRQTETWTDKSLKTEGPMILSNNIFYFKTVMIIGGPIIVFKNVVIMFLYTKKYINLSRSKYGLLSLIIL